MNKDKRASNNERAYLNYVIRKSKIVNLKFK